MAVGKLYGFNDEFIVNGNIVSYKSSREWKIFPSAEFVKTLMVKGIELQRDIK